jgi:hypothetical protein
MPPHTAMLTEKKEKKKKISHKDERKLRRKKTEVERYEEKC